MQKIPLSIPDDKLIVNGTVSELRSSAKACFRTAVQYKCAARTQEATR
jgi:hypothetical protein